MTNNLRLTYIIPSLMSAGAENQTIAQIKELVNRGYSCQIIVLSESAELKEEIPSRVDLKIIGIKGEGILSVSLVKEVYTKRKLISRYIKEFAPTHIICIMPSAFLAGRLINKLWGKNPPKLWLYHRSTEYLINPANNLSKKLYKLCMDRFMSKNDTGHLYISNAVKEDIEANEKIQNGHTIFNALEEIEISITQEEAVLNKYNLQVENYYIFPGRLHPVKGHIFFLEGTAEIIKEQNLKIVIVGDGPVKKKLEHTIADLNLGNYVTMTGKLPRLVVLALQKGSKATIIPSLQEGFGNVAIESMMLGKPTFSSNAGGLKEIVIPKRTGITFSANDKNSLQKEFTEFLKTVDKFNKNEIKNDFKDRFTIQSQVDKLLAIL